MPTAILTGITKAQTMAQTTKKLFLSMSTATGIKKRQSSSAIAIIQTLARATNGKLPTNESGTKIQLSLVYCIKESLSTSSMIETAVKVIPTVQPQNESQSSTPPVEGNTEEQSTSDQLKTQEIRSANSSVGQKTAEREKSTTVPTQQTKNAGKPTEEKEAESSLGKSTTSRSTCEQLKVSPIEAQKTAKVRLISQQELQTEEIETAEEEKQSSLAEPTVREMQITMSSVSTTRKEIAAKEAQVTAEQLTNQQILQTKDAETALEEKSSILTETTIKDIQTTSIQLKRANSYNPN